MAAPKTPVTLPASMQPDMSYVYTILAQRIGVEATRRVGDLFNLLKSRLIRFKDSRSVAIVEGKVQSVGINALTIPVDPSYLFFLAALVDPDVCDLILQKGGWNISSVHGEDVTAVCQKDPSRKAYTGFLLSFPFPWLVLPRVLSHGHSYRGVKLSPEVRIKYAFNPEESQASEDGRCKFADAYIGLLQNYIYSVRTANAQRPNELALPIMATSSKPYSETVQGEGSAIVSTIGCCTLSVCTASVTKQAVDDLASLAVIPMEEVTPMTLTPELLMSNGISTLFSFTRLIEATLLRSIPPELQQSLETKLRQMVPGIPIQTPGGILDHVSLLHFLLAFVTIPELRNWAIEQSARQVALVTMRTINNDCAEPPSADALHLQQLEIMRRETLALPPPSQHLMNMYNHMHLMNYRQIHAITSDLRVARLVRTLNVAVHSARKTRLDQIKEIGNLVVSACCQFVKHVCLSGRYNVLVLPSDIVLEEEAFGPIRIRVVGIDISAELHKHFIFTGFDEMDADGAPKRLLINTQVSGSL